MVVPFKVPLPYLSYFLFILQKNIGIMSSKEHLWSRPVVFLSLMLSAFLLLPSVSVGEKTVQPDLRAKALKVRFVIDGDTIVLEGGTTIRYVGIDTPERGEPYYEEAKEMNKALLKDKVVIFLPCFEDPTDKYGRSLAWVFVAGSDGDELDVGEELLRAGLARTLTIPPCGLKKKKRYRAVEQEARQKGLGIWSLKKNEK